MHFYSVCIGLLTSVTLTAALPTGLSFSDGLKTAIAQKRAQERGLATANAIAEEKNAYQLEVLQGGALKSKRSFDSPIPESSGPQSRAAE